MSTQIPPPEDPTQPKAPERSLGDLVSSLGQDLSGLVSTEIQIAKLEAKTEATKAAKGAGMLAVAALAGLIMLFMLSNALAWGIAEALSPWAGFLIVGILWAVVAAVLGVIGKKQFDRIKGLDTTQEEIQRDKRLAQSVSN